MRIRPNTYMFDNKVRVSCNKLHVKKSELIVDVIKFVDNCSNLFVLLPRKSERRKLKRDNMISHP